MGQQDKSFNYLKKKLSNIKSTFSNLIFGRDKNLYKENLLKDFLQHIEAGDVMIQRSETKSINFSDSIEVILKKIESCDQDIIPVYQDNIDDVKGCIRVADIYRILYQINSGGVKKLRKSIIRFGENYLKSILLNVIVVPPSMQLANLLNVMQLGNIGMAVVVDEFGGSQGFITYDSIINYLAKECDNTDRKLKPDSSGKVRIEARMDLEDFRDFLLQYLKTQLPKEQEFEIIKYIENNLDDSRTVAGLIASFTGTIPEANKKITIGEIEFNIVESTNSKINTVEICMKS